MNFKTLGINPLPIASTMLSNYFVSGCEFFVGNTSARCDFGYAFSCMLLNQLLRFLLADGQPALDGLPFRNVALLILLKLWCPSNMF